MRRQDFQGTQLQLSIIRPYGNLKLSAAISVFLCLSGTSSLSSAVCPLQSLQPSFWTRLLGSAPPQHHISLKMHPLQLKHHIIIIQCLPLQLGLGVCGVGVEREDGCGSNVEVHIVLRWKFWGRVTQEKGINLVIKGQSKLEWELEVSSMCLRWREN